MVEIWTEREVVFETRDLVGFELEANDGVLGRVERVERQGPGEERTFLVLDAGRAMPLGRRLAVPASAIDTVDLDDRRVFVRRSSDEITGGPEFDPAEPIDAGWWERLASYYAPRDAGTAGSASESRSRSSRRTQRAAKPAKQSTRRQSGRGSQPDEPTKEQLYREAKKLGIEGRSKMNKTQLKRAVERRR